MENVTVNTEKLRTQISELSQKKEFYFQTKNDFCSSNYGATDVLASLLSKIQSNYVLISSNIEEIVKYLENYCNNIEGIETMMAHQGGNISESSIYAIVQRSMNLMKKLEISNHSDFSMIPINVNRYSSTSSSNSFTHITLNINASDSYMINFSSLESIMNYFCYYESNNSNALEQIIRKIGAAIRDFTDNENIKNVVINSLRQQGVFISSSDIYKVCGDTHSVSQVLLMNGTIINLDNEFDILSVATADGLTVSFDEAGNFFKYFYQSEDGEKVDLTPLVTERHLVGNSINIFNIQKITYDGSGDLLVEFENNETICIIGGHITSMTSEEFQLRFNEDGGVVSGTVISTGGSINPGSFYENQYYGNQANFRLDAASLIEDPIVLGILRQYFPEGSMEQYEMLMYKINATGCGYIAYVNTVFREYIGREDDFYNDFGFSMYTIDSNGKIDYNYEYLALNYYCYIWANSRYTLDELLVGVDENIVDGALEVDKKTKGWVSTGSYISTYQQFDDFLDLFDVSSQVITHSYSHDVSDTILDYNEMVHAGIENIVLSAAHFDLYTLDGQLAYSDVGAHAMLITGVKDGNFIVSSWGQEFIFDISSLANYENSRSMVSAICYE